MKDWLLEKQRTLSRLKQHLEKNLVDYDIREFLIELNKKPCLFTTSSCSGRVALLHGKNFFDKKNAVIIEKWHDPVTCKNEICKTLSLSSSSLSNKRVWLSLQPPILHISASNEETAERIVKCGKIAGFNRACYHRYGPGGYIVEIAVSDKLHLLGLRECASVLELCDILGKYKVKLSKLQQCLLELNCL